MLKALGRFPEALQAFDEVTQDHTENVVAKCGRAEVLKAMGELNEAAMAYAGIREQHPEDLIARNGYAAVLLMLGKYDMALELLPSLNPESVEDWIGWHIRGMTLLRMGRFDDALSVLELGAGESPLISRDYFHTALAVAHLWQDDRESAQIQLSKVTEPKLRQVGNVIWLHIYAANNNRVGFEQSIAELGKNNPPTLVIELTEELRLRYLDKKQGHHSDQWLREREVDCLALAA
ncbi:MAG: hypothetical protein NTX45_08895 [Proteobacteria bacterium]|nr:hypothetical protein [Pseudomonadota bacterium]